LLERVGWAVGELEREVKVKVGDGRRVVVRVAGKGFKEGTYALYTCSGRWCRL
jgi:hypothetical protein